MSENEIKVLLVHGPLECECACSGCDGAHHWIEDCVEEPVKNARRDSFDGGHLPEIGAPYLPCKHCDAWAEYPDWWGEDVEFRLALAGPGRIREGGRVMLLRMFDATTPAAVRWFPNSFTGCSKPRGIDTVNWSLLVRNLLRLWRDPDNRPVVLETEMIDGNEYNDVRQRIDALLMLLFRPWRPGESMTVGAMSELLGWLAAQGVAASAIQQLAVAAASPRDLMIGVFDQAGGHSFADWGMSHWRYQDNVREFVAMQPIGNVFAGPLYLTGKRVELLRRGSAPCELLRDILQGRHRAGMQRYGASWVTVTHTTLRRETGTITPEQAAAAYIGDDLWGVCCEVGGIWWQHRQAPVLEKALAIAEPAEPEERGE